jgi:deazaflavin-dependent oxidoreductase (nitroreductase family)
MGSRGYDLLWGTALRSTTRIHRIVDRLTGGRVWRRFPGGAQVVWVSTLGRRSGQWRRTPLLAAPLGSDAWAIAGSNAGQEKVPAWVHNLRAHSEGRVEIDGVTYAATFTELSGDERAAAYAKLVQIWKAYAMYESNAGRLIPVFRIDVHASAG